MLVSMAMKNSTFHIHELRAKADPSNEMTNQLKQVLAQSEASLLRKETQKVTEMSQNI